MNIKSSVLRAKAAFTPAVIQPLSAIQPKQALSHVSVSIDMAEFFRELRCVLSAVFLKAERLNTVSLNRRIVGISCEEVLSLTWHKLELWH